MWKWKLLCRLIAALSRTPGRRLRHLTRLRDYITRDIDQNCGSWQTIKSFPKCVEQPQDHVLRDEAPLAVVMQGPVITEDDLTLKTLLLYTKTFPNARLILSTWPGQPADTLRAIERLGITLVVSRPPESPGPFNANYQIRSTLQGILTAQDMRVQYVLKTRTDTRIYATNVGDYLTGLLTTFPSRNSVQRERIIVLDQYTRRYIPNHASDILMFGQIDDMLSYWDTSPFPPCTQDELPKSFEQMIHCVIPEVFLCESYLQRIGYDYGTSISNWWQTLADLFLVVDRASLDFFWPKYNYVRHHTLTDDDQQRNMAIVTFRDWINIALFNKQPLFELDALLAARLNSHVHAA